MSSLPLPVSRDRTQAAAMHLATIFFPIVAPVVALFVGRNSLFLTTHAKQSLKETLILQAIIFLLGAASLIYGAYSLYGHYQDNWQHFSVVPIIARFVIGWIVLAVLQLINTLSSLRNAHRAYRGEWPKGVTPVLPATHVSA